MFDVTRHRVQLISEWASQQPGNLRRTRRLRLPRQPVYFHHVRKTAGTSLVHAFLGLGGEDARDVEHRVSAHTGIARSGDLVFAQSSNPLVCRFGSYHFAWSHDPAWRIRLPEGVFSITMLHDPVARVISLYRYLSNEEPDRDERFPAPNYERVWARDGFELFLERLPKEHLLRQLYMFSPDYEPQEAAQRIAGCSSYFFQESYEEGLDCLRQALDLSLPSRRDRISAGPKPEGEMAEMLSDRLEPEYRMLDQLRRSPGRSLTGAIPARRKEARGVVDRAQGRTLR